MHDVIMIGFILALVLATFGLVELVARLGKR